eukprot:6430648-Prymnesium_polylepis.2
MRACEGRALDELTWNSSRSRRMQTRKKVKKEPRMTMSGLAATYLPRGQGVGGHSWLSGPVRRKVLAGRIT